MESIRLFCKRSEPLVRLSMIEQASFRAGVRLVQKCLVQDALLPLALFLLFLHEPGVLGDFVELKVVAERAPDVLKALNLLREVGLT